MCTARCPRRDVGEDRIPSRAGEKPPQRCQGFSCPSRPGCRGNGAFRLRLFSLALPSPGGGGCHVFHDSPDRRASLERVRFSWNRQRRRGAPFDTPRIKPGATQGEGWVLGGRKSPSSRVGPKGRIEASSRVGPKGRIEGRHAAADQSLSSTSRLVILPRPSTSVSITSPTLRKVPVPMPTPPQVPQTKMSPTSTSAMLEANSICSSGV